MKHKLNKKTITLASTLDESYKCVYEQLLENIEDTQYTSREINYFIRKTIRSMLSAMHAQTDAATFTSHDIKNYTIDENKTYEVWHEAYFLRMISCDRISNSSYIAVIFFSITLVVISAFMNGNIHNWLWLILPGLATLVFLGRKIILSRKMKLPFTHTYGDLIMFLLVSIVCSFSTYYFMVFLWIYDVAFMIYLQLHIVEEDI